MKANFSDEQVRTAILEAVDFFEQHPEKWAKGCYEQKDGDGNVNAWCLNGRVAKIMGVEVGASFPFGYEKRPFYTLEKAIRRVLDAQGIQINDTSESADVLAERVRKQLGVGTN